MKDSEEGTTVAKIAILLPDSEMMSLALRAAKQYQLDLSSISIIDRENFEDVAKAVIQNGADIIIARGGQAFTLKRQYQIPVVDIRITAFEIGLMLQKARDCSEKPIPLIALTGPRNMFVPVNIPAFEEAYQVQLKLYLFEEPEEMGTAAEHAIADGADVVIGGSFVCRHCEEAGVPALRTFSSEESVMEACRFASMLSDALDQEKQYAASLNMLLDRVSSGLIQIDENGLVLRANQFVEHLLMAESGSLKGLPVWRILPGISETLLRAVLVKHKEIRSASVVISRSEFSVSISPILVGTSATGALISFHEMQPAPDHDMPYAKELLKRGYRASYTFSSLITRSPVMRNLAEQAKNYAAFPFPILISGPDGTEKRLLAVCIHNAGAFCKKPFIRIDCNSDAMDEAERLLFPKADAAKEHRSSYETSCTLYLHEVSALSPSGQSRLLKLIQGNTADINGPDTATASSRNIRLIASSSQDLLQLVREGKFRNDVYYALSVMHLSLPPLKMRREDIMGWVDYYVGSLQKSCGRYIHFTKDAQQFLLAYDWPDNLFELKTVCKRLFVNCHKYYIDAADIEAQLDGIVFDNPDTAAPIPTGQPDRQASRIINTLRKYGGNRELSAQELGISTTTLWRQMKKYRIPKNEGKEA